MLDVYPAGTDKQKRGVSMAKKKWQIGELAERAGVSVRTLRHYDAIGLLEPSDITPAGYRLYDEAAVAELEQILYFRELGFALEEIKAIMSSPAYDAREAMKRQRALLQMQKKRIEAMIERLDEAIAGQGAPDMGVFDMREIENMKTQYADEAKARWGGTDAFRESEKRTAAYGKAFIGKLHIHPSPAQKAQTAHGGVQSAQFAQSAAAFFRLDNRELFFDVR